LKPLAAAVEGGKDIVAAFQNIADAKAPFVAVVMTAAPARPKCACGRVEHRLSPEFRVSRFRGRNSGTWVAMTKSAQVWHSMRS